MASIEQLREIAATTLAEALDGSKRVGLVNFPNHGNPGDPGIWLGTVRLLRHLGVRVAYSCAPWNFDPAIARKQTGGAPILINGGGNLGDLYPRQHGTREAVLKTMIGQRVIQLPQSMYFRSPEREAEFADLVRSHGDVTFIAREDLTAQRMRKAFGVDPLRSPDHAFWLSPSHRPRPTQDIAWITRVESDPEFNPHAVPPTGSGVEPFEWMHGIADAERAWSPAGRLALAINHGLIARPHVGRRHWRLARATFEPLARRWIHYGMSTIGSSRVLVTDKLHGHIFAALLGVPHVVMDNSYGKVSGTLDKWSQDLPHVYRAENGTQALEIATRLLKEDA